MSNLFGGTPLPQRFDKVQKADLTGVSKVVTTADARDKEMARRFERAENMRRSDINEAAGYDLAGIGQFGSEIFQQEANEVSELIAKGQLDPTQARMRLGQLKGMYNQFKTHADAISAEDEIAKKLALDPDARKARNASLGVGEELSYGLDDYAATHHTAMNNVFKSGTAQKGPDGQWTAVDPKTGQRVPLTQLQGFANPSLFYNYPTKSVDVGTLGDWAQNKGTASAIAFKDGKWNETRARDYYRDNVLTEDENGRTHRLQILGTLEDRGLVDHLSDDDKKQFRDGVNLTDEKFQEIITKGEQEFVDRSQFDGTYGTKGKGSGSGSGGDDTKKDFVAGGLNVIPDSTGGLLADLSMRSAGSHNLNRFNKPPVLEGAFDVPGKPRTENIQIIGAGVNSKGEQVAYIRGKQRVEVEGAIPGIEGGSDTVPYFKEIPIGGSATGVGSDVMKEIQQNHPEMYQQILRDQDKYEEDKLRAKPIAATSSAVDREGNTVMDAEGNVIRQGAGSATAPSDLPDGGDQASRNEASLEARDAAVDEMKALLEEGERLGEAHMQFLENGRLGELRRGQYGEYLNNIFPPAQAPRDVQARGIDALGNMGVRSDSRDLAGGMRTAGQGPTIQEARSAADAALAEARERSQTSDMTEEDRAAFRQRQKENRETEEAKQKIRDSVKDDLVGEGSVLGRVKSALESLNSETLNNSFLGRLIGLESKPERERPTSRPIQVPENQVADLRETLSPEIQDRLDRALDEAVRRGADGVGAKRNENGDIVVTDRRGVPVPGISPITNIESPEARPAAEVPNPALERSPQVRTEPSDLTAPAAPAEEARAPRASELAMSLVGAGAGSQDGGIGSYEGYSPDLQINVPSGSMNSGVTIAGLDIGGGAEGADEKLEILKDYLRPEDYKELEKLKGLKGEEAQQALAKLQTEGKLLKDGLGLTQQDLNEITARQTEKELPKIYKIIPEKRFAKLPTEVQRVVAGVHFNVPGPKTLAAVNKASKTNDPEDWKEVANKYMTYWSGLSSSLKPEFKKWAEENNRPDLIEQMNSGNRSKDFGDAVIEYKLAVGRILPGNLKRVEDAAAAITKAYNLDPLPSYAQRTSGRAGAEDVAVN